MVWNYWPEHKLVATVEVPDFRIIASAVEGDVGPAIALVPEMVAVLRDLNDAPWDLGYSRGEVKRILEAIDGGSTEIRCGECGTTFDAGYRGRPGAGNWVLCDGCAREGTGGQRGV